MLQIGLLNSDRKQNHSSHLSSRRMLLNQSPTSLKKYAGHLSQSAREQSRPQQKSYEIKEKGVKRGSLHCNCLKIFNLTSMLQIRLCVK